MPRVASQPTGKGGRAANKQTLATPHKSSPIKIPLNDDRTEKAARLQSRQALQDLQMNQIKAAATPMRKMNGYENGRADSSSPRTPARSGRNKENDDLNGSSGSPLNVVSHSAVTPMKRVPILANFEEWMKMATDNKINAANSWNFALIDYFHDMSLLKEGDGVNFQKASCTLDGCVKIYTSRVDSVASETGKLLSGLADSGGGKKGREREGEGDGEEGSEDDEEGEEGTRKKTKKKTQRSHEQSLAPSFASLQLKKLELEFTVDPLFKKASADFDEGGAKGLLLNHLSIDSEGRIVFDSSDDTADVQSYPNATQMQQTLVDPTANVPGDPSNLSLVELRDQDIDLASLASKFFPDLSLLDSQDICPSMKSFTIGDPTSDLNLPFLKAPDNWRENHKTPEPDQPLIDIPLGDKSGIFLDSENAAGFDDDDDGPLGGFDIGSDVGFGEGGEAWAKDAALEPMLRVARADSTDPTAEREGTTDGGMVVGDFDPANPSADAYTVGLNHNNGDGNGDPTENILSYFDAAFKSTKTAAWAGPEHWRIRKIKATQKPLTSTSDNSTPASRTRKEKEPFEIDFLAPMDPGLADMLYTPAASNAAISLPRTQWKTKGRNLLPDDRHFNSRDLVRLWLKPKARVGRRRGAVKGGTGRGGERGAEEEEEVPLQGEMDEAYWARKREEEEQRRKDEEEEAKERKEGDYDANFFADDDGALLPFGGGLPDDEDDDDAVPFTDAREMLSPGPGPNALPEDHASIQPQQQNLEPPPRDQGFAAGSFGSQLLTHQPGMGGNRRLRPEYVNYARVAKKVDVRRLKENLWRGMSRTLIAAPPMPIPIPDIPPITTEDGIAEAAPPTPAPTDTDGDVEMMDVHVDSDPPPLLEGKGEDGKGEDGKGGGELKFTSLIRDLRNVYPEHQMRDISTSYCFICLLHLANEKGLVLQSDEQTELLREIRVTRDQSVGVGYVGE